MAVNRWLETGLTDRRAPVLAAVAGRQAETATAVTAPSDQPISEEIAISATVSVIIPAMNEAENLPHVFASLPSWVHEVVLVDGRSTDDTVAVAQRLRPDVNVVMQAGHGKGDALLAGFAASRGDIIVMLDADGSTDPAEIPRFVAALAAGADLSRDLASPAAVAAST